MTEANDKKQGLLNRFISCPPLGIVWNSISILLEWWPWKRNYSELQRLYEIFRDLDEAIDNSSEVRIKDSKLHLISENCQEVNRLMDDLLTYMKSLSIEDARWFWINLIADYIKKCPKSLIRKEMESEVIRGGGRSEYIKTILLKKEINDMYYSEYIRAYMDLYLESVSEHWSKIFPLTNKKEADLFN